jgi:hypothetical protein
MSQGYVAEIVPDKSNYRKRMDPADRHYLLDFYREDVGKLASLLDRNLEAWLQQD